MFPFSPSISDCDQKVLDLLQFVYFGGIGGWLFVCFYSFASTVEKKKNLSIAGLFLIGLQNWCFMYKGIAKIFVGIYKQDCRN